MSSYDPPGTSGAFFIPDYSFTQAVTDVALGITYQFQPAFWAKYAIRCFLSLAYLSGGYLLLRKYLDPGSDKCRAWLPSCLSSGFLFVTCGPVAIHWVLLWCSRGLTAAGESLLSADYYSDSCMCFFLVFLWFDMLFSGLRFPGHMEVVSGWIHHSVYLLLVSNSLKWGWTNGLSVMFIEEGPTLILGLGQAYPSIFKSEKAFGYSFLILRLIFHFLVVTVAFITTRHSSMLWAAGTLAFLLHLWWFIGWTRRQQRLAATKRRMSEASLDPALRNSLRESIKDSTVYRLDSVLVQETLGNNPSLVYREPTGSAASGDDMRPLMTETR